MQCDGFDSMNKFVFDDFECGWYAAPPPFRNAFISAEADGGWQPIRAPIWMILSSASSRSLERRTRMFIYCGRAAFQTIIGKLLRKLIFVRNIKTTLGCCWHAHVLRVLELCLAAAGWLLQNRRNEFEKYQFSTYVYKQIADRSRRAG